MTTINTNKLIKNKVILLVIGLIFLCFCLLTILPWNPGGYGFDLDESWASAVHVAFTDEIQFGKDFIYTYGPYGFLTVDRYFPETYGYACGFRLLIALAVWAGLFRLVRHCIARHDGSIIFLIPILFFFPNAVLSMDSFQFPIVILPLVLYFYVSKRLSPALVLTIMTASLASLTKHTYLLLCVVFIGLITIDELGKLKRVPRVAPVYLVFIWLFWTIAGQDITNLPAYLINGLQIVSGFSAAMGQAGHLDEIILYLLGTGIFLLSVTAIEWKNRRGWGILPTLGLAAILFITFKGAFTRHDGHAVQALFNITPVILIFTAMLWPSIKKSSWRVGNKIKLTGTLFFGISVLLQLIMGSIILNHYLDYGYGIYSLNIIKHTANKVPQVVRVMSGKGDFQAIVDRGKAAIRSENFLPPIPPGTVDLYPNEIASIFAYDLPYQPRPVFQSFSAYTSKLARLNAEHLKQSDAAATILFDLQPIDGHLASFEDGLSWPEILTRYNITNIEGRYLILQRSSQPRPYQLKPITKEVNLLLGEWFDVPNNQEPVWGKIKIHPNLWGKLATAALRLPPLYLEIETVDGIKTKYRTIGDVMSEGFLLSPILSNRWDFLDLAAANWQEKLAQKQATRFRIVSEGFNSWLYPQAYQFSLSQLQFPRQSFAQVSGWSDWNSKIIPKPLDGGLQRVVIDDNDRTGWMAHSPMKMLIDLNNKKQSFSFTFGILDQGVEEAIQENVGDGVEFKIIALQSNGQEKILFSRKLQPRNNSKDRGIHQASVDLSQIDTTKLFLETVPGEDNQYDWSYWSELKAD